MGREWCGGEDVTVYLVSHVCGSEDRLDTIGLTHSIPCRSASESCDRHHTASHPIHAAPSHCLRYLSAPQFTSPLPS